jgi:hypothetical protein
MAVNIQSSVPSLCGGELDHTTPETKVQLHDIASGNDEAARFVARISSVRPGSIQLREFDSDDIEIDQPYIQRQPDEQFQYEEAEYPGVVYEIACLQGGRELGKAHGLISHTQTGISRQSWGSSWGTARTRKLECRCGSRAT